MGEAGMVANVKIVRASIFPFWWMVIGVVTGFFSGLGFVAWWFGPEDFTHSMALIHEGAGAILGGLIGAIAGLIYKLKRRM
jgi:hypothetical protein